MEHLIASRMNQRNQSPFRLQNLSPEKYGKAAFADMCYTPSKLADNVLYRDVTTLKKYEGDSNKLRQFQALNSFFKDRIQQIEEERDGIEQSLSQQIAMYKKMLHQMEDKHEARIKQIQKKFSTEIHRIIEQKEQEAKYAQSEKELLEARIAQLENIVADLREKLSHQGDNYQDLQNQHEKLTIRFENLTEKLQKTQQRMKEEGQKAREEYENLSRKLYNTEVDWQNKLENAVHIKNKEIQNMQRLHRTQLQKVENKRASENLMRNQQMKDIKQTFENQSKRMNEIINMKDRMVDSLTKQNNKEKSTILELTKNYENQISNLAHEKSRLNSEIQSMDRQIAALNAQIKDMKAHFARERVGMQGYNDKLKEQLQLTQLNYVREKDRGTVISHELERELARLRVQNDRAGTVVYQNEMLIKEVRNLRELLMESSTQMQRCKEEFLKMGCERDQLLLQLREANMENDTLHRINHDREQEARGWKDSYFITRMRN